MIVSAFVSSTPVHAQICDVLNVTPNYPSEATPNQEIAIDVTVVLNCSPYYSYSYLIVRVDLMPTGITRIIATEVFRAYPFLSSGTAHVLVFAPSSIGPWYLDAVVSIVDYTAMGGLDIIARIPIILQVVPTITNSTTLSTTQATSTSTNVETFTTTSTQMLIISVTSSLAGTSMSPSAQLTSSSGIAVATILLIALLLVRRRGKTGAKKLEADSG
jgi:hypothetical protein